MKFNPLMLVPIIALVANTYLNANLSEDQIATAINVILAIVTAVGLKMSWHKTQG